MKNHWLEGLIVIIIFQGSTIRISKGQANLAAQLPGRARSKREFNTLFVLELMMEIVKEF